VSVFAWPARVYWEDTDGGGIVYYANYLRFLERARTEWLRSLGYSQQALSAEPGIVFAVVSLAIEYRQPARLDDELAITCEPEAEGAATMRFVQRIYRGGRDALMTERLLVEANVRVACVDARTLRPKRLPDFLVNGAHGTGGHPGIAPPIVEERS
jgi:acyl-CoA thioester hydrolase